MNEEKKIKKAKSILSNFDAFNCRKPVPIKIDELPKQTEIVYRFTQMNIVIILFKHDEEHYVRIQGLGYFKLIPESEETIEIKNKNNYKLFEFVLMIILCIIGAVVCSIGLLIPLILYLLFFETPKLLTNK